MATRQKLPATLAVAALTTTLYGCGGGGDSRFVDLEEQLGTALTAESLKKLQDERDAARAAQMTAEAERDAANMAKMTAEAAQMTAEAAQRDAEAAQMTAEAAQRDAEAAQRDAEAAQRTAEAAQRDAEVDRDAANMAKMTAEAAQRDAEAAQRTAEAAQRDAEAERDAANMAKTTAEAAQRDAEAAQRDAEMALKALQDKMDAQMLEEEREGRVAMVEAVRLAVSNDRVGSISNDLPFSSDPNASRKSDGMVMIGLDAAITNDGSFPDGSAAAGDVWTGVGLMRDRSMTNSASNKSDTIMVYTDVEASTSVELLEEESNNGMFVVITGGDGQAADRVQHMVLDNAPIVGSILPISPRENAQESHPTFNGKYRGIDGTFTCVSPAGCTIRATEVDGDYALRLDAADRIRFAPDDSEASYPAPDMKYTYFGWWSEKEVTDDLERITDLEPFSGGSNTANITMGMTGTASYTGEAHGKYAIPIYTGGDLTDGEIGTFEARVELNASFGTAASDGMISGEVRDFVTDGTMRDGWLVELQGMGGDEFARLRDDDSGVGGGTNVLFDDFRHEEIGEWKANFYDPGDNPSSDHPGTITGIFDAVTPNEGLLTGGFGAKLDMPPAEQ